MQQVSRRGLLQASLFCAAVSIVAAPGDLAFEAFTPTIDPDWETKSRLTRFISNKYKQPAEVVARIVNSAFQNAVSASLSPLLILAVVAKESRFIPEAVSFYGAEGLMQVVPRMHPEAVAKIEHPDGLFHPESNIKAGTSILKDYLKRANGDLKQALRKYSGGARRYSERVTNYWEQFTDIAYPAKHA
jgi:soluble lytic murein transglycosylase-like protein